jgi:hypothetical protein
VLESQEQSTSAGALTGTMQQWSKCLILLDIAYVLLDPQLGLPGGLCSEVQGVWPRSFSVVHLNPRSPRGLRPTVAAEIPATSQRVLGLAYLWGHRWGSVYPSPIRRWASRFPGGFSGSIGGLSDTYPTEPALPGPGWPSDELSVPEAALTVVPVEDDSTGILVNAGPRIEDEAGFEWIPREAPLVDPGWKLWLDSLNLG